MTTRDTFTTVSSGDQLNEGYFNGIYTNQGTIGINGDISVPIGTVLSWLKSYTNTPALPSGFVECNGQTLSDASSPYDGQVIPDLNGGSNRMLRGAATSGGTGGSDSNSHTHNVSFTARQAYNAGAAYTPYYDSTRSTGAPSDTNNIPAYYEVVWIIRIK